MLLHPRPQPAGPPLTSSLRDAAIKAALLTLVYVAIGHLGLWLPFTDLGLCCLWPTAGVALALLWRDGARWWPGVFIGTLVATLGTAIAPVPALLIAGGNTLSALIGAAVLRRFPTFDARLERLSDVAALALACLVAPVASAALGVVAMRAGGAPPPRSAWPELASAWSGAFLGGLLVAPLVLVWTQGPPRRPAGRQLAEALMLGALVLGGGWIVYTSVLPRPSVLYPLVMWAALRFDLRGATLAMAAVSIGAVWATAHGYGPLVHPAAADTASALEIVVAVTVVLGLVTGSVTAERRDASESLRGVFDAAPLAIVAVDRQNRVTRWNDGAERIFGWRRDEVLGRPLPYVPGDRAAEREGLAARQARGEPVVGVETVCRHRSGSPVQVSLSLARLRDGRGRIIGGIEVIEDIGARRVERDRLRESEARLHTAFESLPFDFWICDEGGRYVVQNSASVRRWGRQVGVTPSQAGVAPEVRALWSENNRRAFAGEVVHGEVEYRLPEGLRHFYNIIAPIRSGAEVRGVLGCNIDITERKRAEAALSQQKEILQTIFDHVPVMISFIGADGGFQWANRAWRERLGWSVEETRHRDMLAEFCPEPAERSRALELMRDADSHWADFRVRTRSGERLDTSWAVVRLSDGTAIGIGQDVSERKQAERALRTSEAQLRQAQKMEAIGRLAGGVAHDFNNLLTSILGHTGIMLDDLPTEHELRGDLSEVRHAAERAADLTSQLLAFSRKQLIEPKVLDLNAIIERITGMLRRLIGAPVELVTSLEPTLGRVLADPGQLEQVLVNLVVNARDAMPEGGRLRIETANAVLDEAFTRQHVGAVAGPHVMLAVIDEGVGIDPAIQPHIFEPFFTTKDKSKGTGLGLATVYGIVKQSGGYISVESEPAHGTAMRVYLPLAMVMPLPEPSDAAADRPAAGDETILLVEDEDSVRGLTRRILAKAGYTVLVARDADEALRVSTQYDAPIDLLLTDVIMAGMSGPRLAETLLGLRKELRVLFMSGYNEDTIVREGVLRHGVAYLQKPFTPSALARRVRDVLDGKRPARNGEDRAAG